MSLKFKFIKSSIEKLNKRKIRYVEKGHSLLNYQNPQSQNMLKMYGLKSWKKKNWENYNKKKLNSYPKKYN